MDRERWDRRYRTEAYVPRSEPSPLVTDHVAWVPDGRALDLATGTGRNARFLAEAGYTVDAVDISGEALRRARTAAEPGDRAGPINWIQADIEAGGLPLARYDVIVVSFFQLYDRLADVLDRLAPGGVLLYEHHLRTADPVDRGPAERWRFGSNDLLRLCSGLTILEYSEARRTSSEGHRAGDTAALVRMVARRSSGPAQSYPERP